MTEDKQFEVEHHDDGGYLVRVPDTDGVASMTLALSGAAEATGGRLADDEPTAHAVIRYLLSLQDARDLPDRVEIRDVLAAYPDAVDGIAELRG